MAVAIIGVVFVSTLLTLFVVPCVYSLFSHLEGKHAHLVPAALAAGNEGALAAAESKKKRR
jgi:hypothetical protein